MVRASGPRPHLLASDAERFDGFGAIIAVDNDVLVIGALRQHGGNGAVCVFGRQDGRWVLRACLTVDRSAAAKIQFANGETSPGREV